VADTPYEYDVIDDFPDEKVDGDALVQEAQTFGLATVMYVNTVWRGDPAREKADVVCSDPLDPADKTTLDGVVAAHTGAPIIAPNDLGGPVVAESMALRNDGDTDSDVVVGRDSVGNMTLADQNTTPKTLTELATAGQPDLSKVLLEESGSLVYTGDGDVTMVE